ncbi:MAG: hypothetical protein AABZ15_00810 [Nitrospirota bacterium]
MINERRGPLIEQTKLCIDKRTIIIRPSRPVSSHIATQSAEHGVDRTLEKDQDPDRGYRGHVVGLSGVSGDPVKNEHIIRGKEGAFKERADDLSGEGELPVFEKQALFENTLDKSDLGRCIVQRRTVAGEYGAELCTEIKVMSLFPEEPVPCNVFAQGALSGTRGTKKKDCLNRE